MGTNETCSRLIFKWPTSIVVKKKRKIAKYHYISEVIKKLCPSVANYIISNPTYYEGIAANSTAKSPFEEKERPELS